MVPAAPSRSPTSCGYSRAAVSEPTSKRDPAAAGTRPPESGGAQTSPADPRKLVYDFSEGSRLVVGTVNPDDVFLLDDVKRRLKVEQETVTASLGVAVYPDHGLTQEALLNAADSALYRAKEQGRDQVAVWELEE